jgi:hypothetical protein
LSRPSGRGVGAISRGVSRVCDGPSIEQRNYEEQINLPGQPAFVAVKYLVMNSSTQRGPLGGDQECIVVGQ